MGQIAHMISLMFPPSPGGRLPLYLQALAETLAIALLGTLTAAVLAFPVGFLAAKNVVPNIFAHFAVRRVLDVFRGIDVLIWALIFVNVVGLGPFAGMLAADKEHGWSVVEWAESDPYRVGRAAFVGQVWQGDELA